MENKAAATPPTLRPHGSRWRSDLGWLIVVTVGAYLVASALELQELVSRRLARLERWQVDELPLTLTVLACGLAWYAWRRRREVQAELVLRERAEGRVNELLARNRELAHRLITVQESERQALARELHDEFAQGCTAIRVETACARHCAPDDRSGMLSATDRADAAAQGLYQLVRDMLHRLRPANLDTLGLAAALQELCESWEERTGVACTLNVEGPTEALGDAVDITVYRIVQEALTNVTRHARASRVRVDLLRSSPRSLSLCVHDDGCGMDVALATRGLGLLGATERAAAVGGVLEVNSSAATGTTLALRIPLPAAAEAAA